MSTLLPETVAQSLLRLRDLGGRIHVNNGTLTIDADAALHSLAAEHLRILNDETNIAIITQWLSEYPHFFEQSSLSHAQQSLWFLHRVLPNTKPYHMVAGYEILIPIHPKGFKAAFEYVVKSHYALHSGFHEYSANSGLQGKAYTQANTQLKPDYSLHNAQDWNDEQINAWMIEQVEKPFDLQAGNVIRIAVLYNQCTTTKQAPDGEAAKPVVRQYVAAAMHHIVGDFRSFEAFGESLFEVYGCIARKKPLPPIETAQYPDWLIEQQRYLASEQGKAAEHYWLSNLTNDTDNLPKTPPDALEIPTCQTRPTQQTFVGKQYEPELSADVIEPLSRLKQQGTTPFTVLFAALNTLFYLYTGRNDFIIGTPTTSRNWKTQSTMMGYTINPVLIRTEITASMTFDALLLQNHQTIRAGIRHQRYPFTRLVEQLNVTRDASRAPLFQHMFTLVKNSDTQATQQFIGKEFMRGQLGSAHDLNLVVEHNTDAGNERYICRWRYNTDLYTDTRMQQFHRHFERIILCALENTQATIGDICQRALDFRSLPPMLATPASCAVQATAQAKDTTNTRPQSALSAWLTHVRRYPQRHALEGALDAHASDTFNTLSYQAFAQRVANLAHALPLADNTHYAALHTPHSHKPNAITNDASDHTPIIAIALPRSADIYIAMFAAWSRGYAFLLLDDNQPLARQQQLLDDAFAQAPQAYVITHSAHALYADNTTSTAYQVIDIQTQYAENADLEHFLQHTETFAHTLPTDHLAYLIYTSGSTGKPKGVKLSQHNLLTYVNGVQARVLNAQDSVCQPAVYSSLAAFNADLGHTATFGALLTGNTLHIVHPDTAANPHALADWWQQHPIDMLKIVPSHLMALAGAHTDSTRLRALLRSLLPKKQLILGGEGMTWDNLEHILDSKPATLRLYNHYGPTEATIGCFATEITAEQITQAQQDNRVLGLHGVSGYAPIGTPLPGYQATVVNADGVEVPEGASGELILQGSGISLGYRREATLTQTHFSIGETHQQRRYHTGDRVRSYRNVQGELTLEYLGRIDQQVKIRGFRVEPDEVAYNLQQAALHAGIDITDVVVVAAPHPQTQQQQLFAYLQSALPHAACQAAIDTAKQQLPEFMQPSAYFVVQTLPRLGNGKRDRKTLIADVAQHWQAQFAQRQQAAHSEDQQAHSNTPDIGHTQSFVYLAELWQRVLNLPNPVTEDDHFFSLGGDSILSLQIVGEARQNAIPLLPKDLFDHPTLANLIPHLWERDPVLKANDLAFAANNTPSAANDTPHSVVANPQSVYLQPLLDIVREVIKQPDLSADDDFFAHGGDSILSLAVVAKAREVDIPLLPIHIFEQRSVAKLSAFFEQQHTANTADTNTVDKSAENIQEDNAVDKTLTTIPAFSLLTEAEHQQPEAFKHHLIARYQQKQLKVCDIYPLTPVQKGMLFHSLKGEHCASYVSQVVFSLPQALNVNAFEHAMQQCAQKHPMLRASFVWPGMPDAEITHGVDAHAEQLEPVQVITEQLPIAFNVLDWENFDQQALDSVAFNEREASFGLHIQAPLQTQALFRCTLIHVGEQASSYLVWTAHHLLGDGWSAAVILNDLLHFYTQQQHGYTQQQHGASTENASLNATIADTLAIHADQSFKHYIAWLQQQDAQAANDYWQTQLLDANTPKNSPLQGTLDEPPRLPFANTTQHVSTGAFFTDNVDLSEDLSRQLRTFARQCKVTLNTLFQGAWALLLADHSDARLSQQRVNTTFGVTSSGRPAALEDVDIHQSVGAYIATLPLCLSLDAKLPLSDFFAQLQQQNSELRQYEYASLADIQALQKRNTTSAVDITECVNSLFVFENTPGQHAADHSDRIPSPAGELHIHQRFSRTSFPLALEVLPASTIRLRLDAEDSHYQPASMHLLLQQFAHILQQFASISAKYTANTEIPEHITLGDISLTSEAAAQQLHQWEHSPTHVSRAALDKPWLTRFLEQVEHSPSQIALSSDTSETQYTFRELAHAAEQRAVAIWDTLNHPKITEDKHQDEARLSESLQEPLIAILTTRDLDYIVTLVACQYLTIPWMPLDPAQPPARWQHVLQQADAQLLIVDASIDPASLEPLKHDVPVITDIDTLNRASANTLPAPIIDADRLAYVLFTSGSTGTPKGVMITQQGMLNNILAKVEPLHFRPGVVIAQSAPQCFDISVWQCLAGPIVGGRTHQISSELMHDPLSAMQHIQAERVNILEPVPSWMSTCLDQLEEQAQSAAQTLHLNDLDSVLPTGEALPPALATRWLARFDIPLINAYGPAECADDVSFGIIDRASHAKHNPQQALPIGRPTANAQLLVLDAQQQRVPIGVPGQLAVAGLGVGRGYRHDAERTQAVFVPHAFDHTQRMYLTGDSVRRLADGQLQYLGRMDFQLKIRGQRLEPGEIEAVIEQLPMIKQAVVVAKTIQNSTHLIAFITHTQQAHTSSTDAQQSEHIIAHIAEQLPAYMVPSAVVILEAMPLNANGKLDRKQLQSPQFGPHTLSTHDIHNHYQPLSNQTQQALADIWASLLHIDVLQIGASSQFFALGGHSLLTTRLANRIQREWQVSLSLATLFEHQQLSAQATLIEHELQRTTSSAHSINDSQQAPAYALALAPVARDNTLPLSFAQQRLWSVQQLNPEENSAYNMCGQLAIEGPLSATIWQQALNALVARHEVLRTGYVLAHENKRNAGPQLVIASAETSQVPTQFHDLQQLSDAEQQVRIAALADEEAHTAFDLTQPMMLRTQVICLAPTRYHVLVSVHHIACDGWSVTIMIEDILRAYHAIAASETPDPTDLPIQYADFAHWQRQQLQGDYLNTLSQWWKTQLDAAPALLQLPTDFPRPEQQDTRGDAVSYALDSELSQALYATASKHNVSLYMLMLSAFNLTLLRIQRAANIHTHDIVIGTDLAGRLHADLEPLVGCFVNVLPIRQSLNDVQQDTYTLADVLSDTKSACLSLFEHQHMPFDLLVEQLNPARSSAYNPIVQALFVMQNTPTEAAAFKRYCTDELHVTPITSKHVQSKFDFALFVDELTDETETLNTLINSTATATPPINLRWVYQQSLYRRARIQHWLEIYVETLNYFTRGLDMPVSRLISEQPVMSHTQETPPTSEPANVSDVNASANPSASLKKPSMNKSANKLSKGKKLSKLKSSKQLNKATHQAGNAEHSNTNSTPNQLHQTAFLSDTSQFPIIVKPAVKGLDANAWAANNRDEIERLLSEHAAILFRDFPLRTPQDFEAFAQAIYPGLYGNYGDLPKKEGGKNTYRSTPYPEKQMILFHNESSHTEKWPRLQWFFSEIVAPVGGATPIVDCREMYRRMPADILRKLEEKQLMYVRNFTDKIDVSWQHFFKTEDKADVERVCTQAGIEFEWFSDSELQTRTICPAVLRHPKTQALSFFNQVQLHHISCLEPQVREDLLEMVGIDRMPRNVYYGDGTPIEDEVMQVIGELYEACAIRFDWQQGDVVMVDNMLTAHARDPFEGPRKIVVAMGDLVHRHELDSVAEKLAK